MKLFCSNQQARLALFLQEFRERPFSYTPTTQLREKETSLVVLEQTTLTNLSFCNVDFLFAYNIFPDRIMTFAADWQQQGRTMQEGDVIVQQIFLPPWPLSLKCIFAVRVLQTFRDSVRVGFRYGTLKGHAEMGISEFSFSLHNKTLYATIHTYSSPGILLAQVVAPLFTLPYQQYCTNQALQHLRTAFLESNRAPL